MSDSESINACKECVAGQYQDQEGKATCKSCPAGKWSNKVQAKNENDCLDCQIGKFSAILSIDFDCIFCPAGTRGKNEVTGGTNITVCQACAVGRYRNGSDLIVTSCRNCPIGQVMPFKGATKCIDCIPGKFQDQEGNESCIKCASGRQQSNANIADVGISAVNCVACDKGQYQPEEGSTFCLPCLIGTFQNMTGSSSCNNCSVGFSNGETKKESCTLCKEGRFQDAIQEAVCKGMLYLFVKDGSVLGFFGIACFGELERFGETHFFPAFFCFFCSFLFTYILLLLETQQSAQQAFIQLKLALSPTMFALDARKERIPLPLV